MTDEPYTREEIWHHLADMVGMVVSLFGAPAAIAAQRFLRIVARAKILHWLAPLEALARRLLLLEAAALPPANAPPPRIARLHIANTLRDAPEFAWEEDASQWRVRFSIWPYGAHRRARREPREGKAPRRRVTENALVIARRVEALWRVLENRRAHVQRMARMLAARRASAYAAFAPYRFGGPAKDLLHEVQREIDTVFSAPFATQAIPARPPDA